MLRHIRKPSGLLPLVPRPFLCYLLGLPLLSPVRKCLFLGLHVTLLLIYALVLVGRILKKGRKFFNVLPAGECCPLADGGEAGYVLLGQRTPAPLTEGTSLPASKALGAQFIVLSSGPSSGTSHPFSVCCTPSRVTARASGVAPGALGAEHLAGPVLRPFGRRSGLGPNSLKGPWQCQCQGEAPVGGWVTCFHQWLHL